LRALADSAGLLLVFDEVQCGLGRTGRLWAHEWAGVTPDIMMVAKGLGGGFPIGALLATERAASCMGAGTHGSTYGGNPLGTAIGNAVLDIVLESDFLPAVSRHAELLDRELRGLVARYPTVLSEVRGGGLLLGLKTVVPNTDLVAALRAERMLAVGAADNVVRILPPLIAGPTEIAEAAVKLAAACAFVAGRV
jgi:acetylornithine/N-succinyldiaminopimelate aminotransferase